MKYVYPIFLLLLSGMVYFQFIDPQLAEAKAFKAHRQELRDKIVNLEKIKQIRDDKLALVSAFPEGAILKTTTLLPDKIDPLRLIATIDKLSAVHGFRIQSPAVNGLEAQQGVPVVGDVGTAVLKFSVAGPYSEIRTMLREMEDTLQILDFNSLSLSVKDDAKSTTGIAEYAIELKTYWLR